MAKRMPKNEAEEDYEEVTDLNTVCSGGTFKPENPEVLSGGEHLTPEGESSSLLSEKSSAELDGSHTVTYTWTVSLAVPALPTGQKQKESKPPGRQGKRGQANELGASSRMRRYYHIEYFLLPDDLVPRKLDLLLAGRVAKLFTDSNSEIVTPWIENNNMWIAWNHSRDISVTNEYLIKLRDHKIILKIWNTKGKISTKGKLPKPNIVSSLEGDAKAVDGVKHTVLWQRKLFEESQPAPSRTKIKAAKESKAQEESSALPVEAEETDLGGQATSGCGLSRLSSTGEARFLNKTQLLKQKAGADPPVNSTSKETEKTSGNLAMLTYKEEEAATTYGRRGSGPERKVDAAVAKKDSIAWVQLDIMPLLAGEKSVISRLAEDNPDVLDGYVTFTVETPLLSERQRHELNPLIIRIHSATCLPNTPVPIEVLQRLCVPTYCKYKFHNFPPHRTHGQVHGTHVYFKDVNVFLTGTMKPGELERYLRGPPLEIEVHDRDRNMENTTKKPSLLGEDEADKKVGKVSFLACKSTVCNSFMNKEEWHPHGVAKVSLIDLLLGRKYLTISAPIHNCPAPTTAALSEEDKNEKITELLRSSSLLPMGHYLHSDSLLKVRVEMAVPLGIGTEMTDAQDSSCPFGCIIYIFDHNNSSLLHDLVGEITEINDNALRLDGSPVRSLGMALAAAQLETTLEKVSQLDVVTGFHLLDRVTHLFVLEGLKDKAIKRLWDRHFERTYRREAGRLEVLYNSHLSFHQRLYSDLEALCYHFHLRQPLPAITKQPLLYVRGVVPRACFQALSRLSYLCHSKRLRDVIHRDLLPSAEMIRALSREYGGPLTDEDLFTQKPPSLSFSPADCTEPGKVSREKQAACWSLDNGNKVHALWKKGKRNRIGAAAACSLKGKAEKPAFDAFRIYPVASKSVFNYSSQSLSSAQLAKQHLRQEMAKEPKKRFTYCHEYLSATFAPVDVAAACKEFFAKSKSMWLTQDGFVFPGVKSSIESNLHPRLPDKARREELREKWQENALHANMEPVLPRGRWSWDKRHVDFDLYKKPPELLMTTASPTDAPRILQTVLDDTKLPLSTSEPRARSRLQTLQDPRKAEPLTLSLGKAGQVLQKRVSEHEWKDRPRGARK